MQMEAAIKKYTSEIFLTEDDLYDADKKQPPRFVTQIKDQTSLTEMQTTKFECQLAPVGDPNMKVEWFFNGKPLPFSKFYHPFIFLLIYLTRYYHPQKIALRQFMTLVMWQ